MSTRPAPILHLWLPALQSFDPGHPLLERLRRADRLGDGAAGYLGGLGEFFPGVDANLPAAAITREFLVGDAADTCWLSADPAWVQPDMTGARLLACGQLQLDMAEARALAEPLLPVFAEAGMRLLVSTPDRWHVQLPAGLALPKFDAPEQAMGEDLSQHLPAGAEGRQWRILLNDIQVLLHQHPLNVQRRARQLTPVNSLWLWGGGRLPQPLRSTLDGAISEDVLLCALAARADVVQLARTLHTVATARAGWLVDLQDLPATEIASTWWPSLQPLFERHPLQLHFGSGERWLHRPWHRWRFWRGSQR
ncbi:MAG: phosphoglycerate mutase [Rhodanobacter sp.]|nr:MAG: phosphoglycerate mutase [Rhodanobacter sp.]TAL89619.1 MAG: phosphoglycerate mutase [Rhodanobacter sp.]TAM43208.1 MAG: phosphoglycerate mutase [Rhodanobacter sp.]TAN25954.1 MAG: phosphoglycerate mutase [Rhodanobacter sp.]